MLKVYLKLVYRMIVRQSYYSFTNILGLSLGGASIISLFLVIYTEFGYEKDFPNYKLIYRITYQYKKKSINEESASTPLPLAGVLKKRFVNRLLGVAQLFNYGTPYHLVKSNFYQKYESSFYFSNTDFLRVFDVQLVAGSSENFGQNNKILISEREAKRYFPVGNAIGSTIYYESEVPLEVIGVFRNLPTNSHLKIGFLASFATTHLESFDNWVWNSAWTYVQISNSKIRNDLIASFPEIINKHYFEPEKNFISFSLQNISSIHLDSELQNEISVNSQREYIFVLIFLAFAIFLNAFINFFNLTVSQVAKRRKEFFVKKVVGAQAEQLFRQLWFESSLISLLALFMAFVLAEWFMPFLSFLFRRRIDFYQTIDFSFFLISVLFTILLAGIVAYLAYINVEKTKPIYYRRQRWQKFKNYISQTRFLIFIQYTLSVSFLIIALLNVKQLYFIVNTDLGFRTKDVVIVPVFDTPVADRFSDFSNEISKIPDIRSFCGIDNLPGLSFQAHKFSIKQGGKLNSMYIPTITFWHDFMRTFDIRMKKELSDTCSRFFINEKMNESLDFVPKHQFLGKILKSIEGNQKITGIVKDFQVNSLFQPNLPLVVKQGKEQNSWQIKYLALYIPKAGRATAIAKLKRIWKQFVPDKYIYLQDYIGLVLDRYHNEKIFALLLFFFSLVSFIISLLGLVGLTAFMTEQHTRNIAIRKVLGASLTSIIQLYFKELIWILFSATLLAFPISYFTMNWWLDVLAVEPKISWFLFIEGALIALLSAFIIIFYFSYRAYNKQMLEAVKYE